MLARVKAQTRLEEVVGRDVALIRRGTALVGRCPFHDDHGRPNLVVFPATQSWFCFSCGAHGDAIDFVARRRGLSLREAAQALTETASFRPPLRPASGGRIPTVALAPAEERDHAYRALIASEALAPGHLRMLLGRGFTAKEVAALEYRTHRGGLAPDGFSPGGVPGFYRAGERWRVAGPAGLLIPVRDALGRVLGCQIRPEQGGHGKYVWLSGARYPGGVSSGAPCHVALTKGSTRRAWVTEGPLKADFAALRLGQPVIGVAGATNWRSALGAIEKLCPEEVVLAFDRDENPSVRQSVERCGAALAEALRRRGVRVLRARWDTAKGIDDAIVVRRRVRTSPLLGPDIAIC